jgi:hypothetical protein
MLILPTQMILFQYPFERGDAQLYVEKIRFVKTFLLFKKLDGRKVKSQNYHYVVGKN